jgi:outer membrane protein assembly factor BamB
MSNAPLTTAPCIMRIIRTNLAFIFCAAVLCWPSGATARPFKSCGMADVDQIRKEVQASPTTPENFESRRAALARWWRLLWRQGYDMSAMSDAATNLVHIKPDSSKWMSDIDTCFSVLEEIQEHPKAIEEVRGSRGRSMTQTDWPMYMSTDGSNSGFSPDAGPSEGKIAWKFPKNFNWDAQVVMEGSKVYVASPGPDVVGYCLDARTGNIEWRARQYGFFLYETRGSYFSPMASSDCVIFRTGGMGTDAAIFDKRTGQRLTSDEGKSRQVAVYGLGNGHLRVVNARTFKTLRQYDLPADSAGEPVLDGENIYAAATDGSVFCFDSKSQSATWSTKLPGELIGEMEVANHQIHIGSKNGTLFCLNAKDGTQRWSWQCPESNEQAAQFFSKTMTVDTRTYVGTASGHLYCLDASTGNLIWEYQTGSWIRSRPFVLGNMVFVATLDGDLIAIMDEDQQPIKKWGIQLGAHGTTADLSGDPNRILVSGRDMILYSVSPQNGTVQWKHGILDGQWIHGEFFASSWFSGLMTTPTVVDGVVYVGGPDGFVNAIDAQSGQEKWRFEVSGLNSVAPVVAEGKVFAGQMKGEGSFYALDQQTGKVIWKSAEFGRVWVAPAYHDGLLFFGDIKGNMFGVRASDGETVWSFFTGDFADPKDVKRVHGVYSNPCIDDENVYVGAWSGSYFALNQKTGKMLWQTRTMPGTDGGRPDSAAPMVHKGHLYVQKGARYLAALDKHTGELKWQWEVPRGYLQNGTMAAHGDRVVGSYGRSVTKLPYNTTLVAFKDVESGSEKLWEYNGGGGLTAPVLTEDHVIFGSSADPFVTCLTARTGKLEWRTFTGGEMLENVPAIYGDKVFVHGKNGWIFAIE